MNKKIYRDVWLIVVTSFLTFNGVFASVSFGMKTELQDREVSGKVISNDGETLAGVNILIKGTTTGTVTDSDGNFRLQIPNNDVTLVFSFIGFLQEEVVVGNQSTINITLTSSLETLGEIVVIGYGTVKKSDLTGSVSSVKAR